MNVTDILEDYILKKKLGVLLLGCFMAVFSVFSLCSCSLVKTDLAKKNGSPAMTVGSTTLTKNDVINQFYTYYQSNSNYFAYYDQDTILNSFYTWVAMRQIVNENSSAMLYDPDTNKTGYIVYTNEDEKDVWKSVYEYFYSQVNTYEKAIYKLEGYEDDALPVWLKSEEDKNDTTLFEPYKSIKPEIKSRQEKIDDFTKKLADQKVKEKVSEVQKYLFEYVTGKDTNDEDIREKISYDGFIEGSRNDAYIKYVEWLVSSAKSAGKSTDIKTVLENEVLRVYQSYYESKITSLFQNFYVQEYLTNYYDVKPGTADDGKLGDTISMSEKSVVKAYLDKYYADKQSGQVSSSFISTITSSDGATLVLYNYNGRNFFFTVQHILVQLDDYIKAEINKNLEGSTGSNTDYDSVIAEYNKTIRDNMTKAYKVLGAVKKDTFEKQKTIASFVSKFVATGDVAPYFYDETAQNDETGSAYIKLSVEGTTKADIFDYEGLKYYYTKTEGGDKVYVDPVDIKWLASQETINKIYEDAYKTLVSVFENYYDALVAGTDVSEIKEQYSDLGYIFDVVDNIKETYTDANEAKKIIRQKVASFAFVELEFIFSTDNLKNELSGKIGYVMSNYPDENGSWVVDFAVGARDIITGLIGTSTNGADVQTQIDAALASGDLSKLTKTVISDYGYHIIKVENVYEQGGSLVDMSGIDEQNELTDEYVAKIAALLKKTYVCSASNQTVYDYFYDELYTAYAGTSSSSGTYFLKLEYEWLHNYYKEGKIIYEQKPTYDELMDAIS